MTARTWLQAGYQGLIPVIPAAGVLHPKSGATAGKTPGEYAAGAWDAMAGWHTYVMNEVKAARIDELGANLGLRTGEFVAAADVDITDDLLSKALRDWLRDSGFPAPLRIGKAPKFALLVRVTGDPIVGYAVPLHREDGPENQAIEVLGLNRRRRTPQQMVVEGMHPCGAVYEWFHPDGTPYPAGQVPRLEDLPVLTQADMDTLVEALLRVAEGRGWTRGRPPRETDGEISDMGAAAPDPALIDPVVDAIPNADTHYDDWVAIGFAIYNAGGTYETFAKWSAKAGKNVPAFTMRKWREIERDADGGNGFGKLVGWARDAHGNRLPGNLESDLVVARSIAAGMPEVFRPDLRDMDLKAPETVAAAAHWREAYPLEYGVLELQARTQRCLTAFRQAISEHQGAAQVAAATAEKPEIRVFDVGDPNQFLGIAQEIETLIADRDLMFSFGGNAVKIRELRSDMSFVYERDGSGAKVLDDKGVPVRTPEWVTRAHVAKQGDFLTAAAEVGYFTKGSKPAAIPGALIQMLEASAGAALKPIRAIASHPVYQDGELFTGDRVYNDRLSLYMDIGALTIETWTDAAAAYQFLRHEWLGDFPFDTEKDAAAALCIPASMLVVKTETAIVPIFGVTAPSAGTGKTFLCSVLECAVTGKPGAASLYPENREEREKMFISTVMQGSSAITFDNVQTGSTVGSSHKELAAFATTEILEGRILGGNKKFVGPAACVPILNGNNLMFAGDMVSRTVEIRLVQKDGVNLARRQFRHTDIIQWTQMNRGRILGALACILRTTDQAPGMGRFQKWSRIVARPLINVTGVTDFYDEWIAAAEADEAGAGADNLTTILAVLTPRAGQWLSAHEILAVVPTQTLHKIFHSDVSVQRLTDYLWRHRDQRTVYGVLRGKRKNLGERTGRKERRVFLLER